MFAFLRPSLPPRTNTASSSTIVYEDGASSVEFFSANSDYIFRNIHPPFNKDRPSIMTPPPHYHIYQTENFRIVSGSVNLFKDKVDKPWLTLSADDPDAPKTATVPKRVCHTIHNASTTEKLVVDVKLSPENYEAEQQFFRNFFGYLDDCRKAESPPSIFQLMVFLHAADTPIALPLSGNLGFLASRLFLISMALWGKWALGYKTSYPEYYVSK